MITELRTIKPVNGHIVLKELENEEQMVGNIYVPDMGKEKSLVAEVVETSATYNYHNGEWKQSEVEVGQHVIIPRMGSQIVSVDGEDFIVCKDTDVIGIVK